MDPLIESDQTTESAMLNEPQAEPSPETLTASNPSSSSEEGPLHTPFLHLSLEPRNPAPRGRLLDLPINPFRTIPTDVHGVPGGADQGTAFGRAQGRRLCFSRWKTPPLAPRA